MLNHPCTVEILFSLSFGFAEETSCNKTQIEMQVTKDSFQHQHVVKFALEKRVKFTTLSEIEKALFPINA